MRPGALVTGASSGIGEQLARQLAASGHDLFLVARGAARLQSLAAELSTAHGVEVHVHGEDLSEPGGPARVIAAVQRSGLDLALLVNNAGTGLHGPFAEQNDEALARMVALNVVALQALTRGLLPVLLRRGAGGVLNVGSTAGLQPLPYMASYAASKAFVNAFSQALADELRDTGVKVTVLCPGPTETGFAAVAGVGKTRLFADAAVAGAEEVARAGLAAVAAGKPFVITGMKNRLRAFGARFVSRAMLLRISRGLMAERDLPA